MLMFRRLKGVQRANVSPRSENILLFLLFVFRYVPGIFFYQFHKYYLVSVRLRFGSILFGVHDVVTEFP